MNASATLLKAVLLGGIAIGSLLSAALPASAEVGVAAAVNIDAKGRPPGAAPRVITLGSNVVFKEEIITDAAGLVQILLLDGTTFTVGPNSQLTIDEFVYDPNTGDAKVVASLTKGVFRFVGARTSQTEGGATVKTPVGTIGIRGGVANFSCDGGECKASLVAGKSLTIVDGDGTQRIVYETGYTAVIAKDPSGGTTTTVRKSTKDETGLIQKQLSSKPGQNGGNTGDPPSDEQAEQVAETNSGLPPTMDVPGSTKPVQSSEPDQVEEVAGIDGKTQDDIDNDIEEEEEPPTVNARVLTAPEGGFVVDPDNGGGTVPDAGPRGLVGSTPDSDQNLLLTVQGGRLATSDGTTLDLPDYSGTEGDGPVNFLYEPDDFFINGDATYLGQELTGKVYAGRGDFAAYFLGVDDLDNPYDNPALQPVYVIYGTPTANPQAIFTDSNAVIREYALTEDPIGPIEPVPFFRDDIYGVVNEYYDPDGPDYGVPPQIALSSTNLIIVETDGGSDMRAFQSWVHISGEGDQQKSAAFLYTAGVGENDDGKLMIDGGRRGTYRTDAYVGPVNMRGGVASIGGATGDHFFGENADHFVIGATPSPADHYSDVALDNEVYTGGFDGAYGTHHVASLVGQTPLTEYESPGCSPCRTTRDVTGFISGMGESSANANPYVLTSSLVDPDGIGPLEAGPNLTLHLDSDTNTVQGEANLFDVLNQDAVAASYLIGFGRSGQLGGGSAFVDDDVFGAQKDNDPEKTRIRTDGSIGDPDDVPHTGQFTPGTYLVSGRANPIDGYQHCEDCDFIDWGWWGTRVEVAADASDEITEDRVDYVHMGTWVAGDILDPDDVPDEGGATFVGTALGTVARETDDGVAQYIARGNAQIGYDFVTRTADVEITDFDGMNVFGTGLDTSTTTQQLFSGSLTDCISCAPGEAELTGNFSGAIVGAGSPNVAAGAIGDFSFSGTNLGDNVSAVGTFATKQAF